MRAGLRLLVGVLLGALIWSPVMAAEKPEAAPAAPAGTVGETAARTPVQIQGEIPVRPELQIFQGVKGWLVNGQEIKLDQVKDRAVAYHGPYVLQDMVVEMLLQQQADKRGLTASDAEIDKKIEQLRQEGGLTTEAARRFLLEANGLHPRLDAPESP